MAFYIAPQFLVHLQQVTAVKMNSHIISCFLLCPSAHLLILLVATAAATIAIVKIFENLLTKVCKSSYAIQRVAMILFFLCTVYYVNNFD